MTQVTSVPQGAVEATNLWSTQKNRCMWDQECQVCKQDAGDSVQQGMVGVTNLRARRETTGWKVRECGKLYLITIREPSSSRVVMHVSTTPPCVKLPTDTRAAKRNRTKLRRKPVLQSC
jgi:hypothetical protein